LQKLDLINWDLDEVLLDPATAVEWTNNGN